ncbi:MAG: HD domain-containing protein [Alloprevotella sp.]|nr:MAG: HD domain-containing protein [Alloprevotella sp.]
MDYLALLHRYYPEDNALRRMLLHHSRQVCARALQIVERHPELGANRNLVEAGAMLHDIGIFLTDAPGIHCHGTAHYILHGSLGAQLLRNEAKQLKKEKLQEEQLKAEQPQAIQLQEELHFYEALARICERHTGTGLTRQTIIERGLPDPQQDLLPETIEEQIICYADKFYSKSHLERERTIPQTLQSLEKFGDEGVEKFRHWTELFE